MRIVLAVLILGSFAMAQTNKECLIVRSAEGHRFRDSMIAGALTGGIGFAAGAAFGGGKYDYVDSFNMTGTQMKYKGGALQKLQEQGVHIVTINKKAGADEIKSARESCTTFLAPAPTQPSTTTQATPTPNAVPTKPASSQTAETTQVDPDQSLGEAARQIKAQKQSQ